MKTDPQRRNAAGLVAIILALGISTALNLVTGAILYAAYIRVGIDVDSGISDKGVQILLAWGGGIISVLAGYVGFIVGKMGPGTITPPDEGKKSVPLPSKPPDKA